MLKKINLFLILFYDNKENTRYPFIAHNLLHHFFIRKYEISKTFSINNKCIFRVFIVNNIVFYENNIMLNGKLT